MIKILIDLIQFLYSTLPLIMSVAIFTLLGILLSKSIKKHPKIYYIVLGIPFALVVIPFVARMFGFEIFNFSQIPFLGGILRDYIHMGTFGFPLLIIIMYIGALNPKIAWVKKLLVIRKELSIISGFPILTHSLIRVTNTFPNSLKFFTNNEEYTATANITSELGAGISNFSFVLGIVLLIIFIPLWVTSFDSIHKRLGSRRWKKIQKWSYVLYALLFIHSMGIQVGGLLNPRGGGNTQKTVVENVQKNITPQNRTIVEGSIDNGKIGSKSNLSTEETSSEKENETKPSDQTQKEPADHRDIKTGTNTGNNNNDNINKENSKKELQIKDKNSNNKAQEKVADSSKSKRPQSIGFSDINVSSQTKKYIHIFSLILIFGSYLYLRLRKAKLDREKKKHRTE